MYLFRAVARENERDERLMALAEIRDLTPVRDEHGRTVVRYDDEGRPELTLRTELYREWLKLAGVTRPELFVENKVRRQTRIHDLRGLFVSTALAKSGAAP